MTPVSWLSGGFTGGSVRAVRIHVNGEPREVPDDTTVAGLLTLLGVDRTRVAVERNRDVIPKRDYDGCRLASDDRLEVVTFVGGG